jgi:ubiquinone/menaquinone biosynthesis C-methylase UbiE
MSELARTTMSERTHGEFTGAAVRHYDRTMDLFLLGRYQNFIERAIGRMNIRRGDAILDLGSGSARNICVMLRMLGDTGRVVGVDSSGDMIQYARQRCSEHPQASFIHQRIEEPLPFCDEFDKVVIAFALHSLEDEDKVKVLRNVRRALRRDGILWILDFNEFDLERQWPTFRWAFRRIECDLGIEFLSLDLKAMLADHGFGSFASHPFLRNHVRLLGAKQREVTDEQRTHQGAGEADSRVK